MPNVASVLKEEIRRLSRKEARSMVAPLKKALAAERKAVAALRKQVGAQATALKRLGSKRAAAVADAPAASGAGATTGKGGRAMVEGWRKDTVRSTRRALALTQAQFAKLAGVSQITISFWETGRSTPRYKQQVAVMEARKLSRAAAHKRLGLAPGSKPRRGRPSNAELAARKAAAAGQRKAARKPGRKPGRKPARKAKARKGARAKKK